MYLYKFYLSRVVLQNKTKNTVSKLNNGEQAQSIPYTQDGSIKIRLLRLTVQDIMSSLRYTYRPYSVVVLIHPRPSHTKDFKKGTNCFSV